MVRPDDTSQGYAGGKFWGQPKQKNFPPQASRSGYQPHSATQPLPRSASAAANLGRSAATPPLPQGGDSHSNNNSNSHSTAATVRFSKPPRVPTEGGPGGGGGGMLMGTDGVPEPAAAMLLPEHARTAPPPQTNSSRSMADPTDGPIAGWAADTPGSVRTIVLEDDAGPATSAEQEQYMHQQRQHMVRGGGGGGGSGSGGGSRANQQRKSETMQAAAQQLDGNSDAEGVPMDIMGAFKDLMHGSAALFQQTMSKVGEKRVKELQREKADHKVRQ